MKKLTLFLAILIIVLMAVVAYQYNRLQSAEAYIGALENDYPEFIDTTSGTDEYNEWYR